MLQQHDPRKKLPLLLSPESAQKLWETLPQEEWREIAKALPDARNSKSLAILSAINFLARCEPEEAKALACLQYLSLCKDNNIYQPAAECGCAVVVETTSDISQFCSQENHRLPQVISVLQSIKRDSNVVAHVLAGRAIARLRWSLAPSHPDTHSSNCSE
jgi:hypothetical protein